MEIKDREKGRQEPAGVGVGGNGKPVSTANERCQMPRNGVCQMIVVCWLAGWQWEEEALHFFGMATTHTWCAIHQMTRRSPIGA